ncbi:hypothetical protein OAK35_01975 [Crocinitomicaceae bacterium]|nr:hypothetical protein [Crocinitomicaceae bacterium]
MKFFKNWFRTRRFWKRFIITLLVSPIILFAIGVTVVYVKQDEIVQEMLADMNKDFKGSAEIEGSHISLFENFPYISIDLEGFKVYETKDKSAKPLVNVKDAYIGFDMWTIVSGNMEVKKIKLKGGHVDLVQHEDGSFNIANALSPEKEIESAEEEFHLDLQKIDLEDIDITKLNEANGLKVEAFVSEASSQFRTAKDHVYASLDAKFIMNIIQDGDTTFFKHKHVDLSTEVDFRKGVDIMTIEPTIVTLEGADFKMKGSVDFLKDMLLDLDFGMNKNNFDLFIAVLPEETMKMMQTYENKGNIYLKTTIKGRSINGHNPAVRASFGCKNGYFKNKKNGKTLKGIAFKGYFTNGDAHDIDHIFVKLTDIKGKPGAGSFGGNIQMQNLHAPNILLDANADLNLSFFSKFLNMKELHHLKGTAKVNLNYHDVIDLENPEKTLSELNQNYKLNVNLNNVRFEHDDLPVAIKDFDLNAKVKGHEVAILKCDLKAGKSDVHITGIIEDLPAIIHHSNKEVDTRLTIASTFLDIYELTGGDENAVDEQISDLSMDFDFKASARSFTESKYLPKGEFFIENLYGKLKHYPHTLHDFHADIFIEEEDLRVVDFSGMIDKSDFHFSGMLEHYEKWMDEHPGGDSKIEFDLASDRLLLESLFSYKGENFVPEDYRHEEFDDLHIHGFTYLHYEDELKSIDLTLDKLEAKMKVHPLRLRDFQGRVHYENDHLVVEDFQGKMGHSNFTTTLHYYLGDDPSVRKRDNHFSIVAPRLDIDELSNYNPGPVKPGNTGVHVEHEEGFNIYELPFTDMTYHMDIDLLDYHTYRITNFKGELRTTPDHYIHVDNLNMNMAGGHFDVSGYFNGSDPEMIYFNPTIKAKNVDLDQLLLRFENFGQDYIVSENLHGKFTGTISGKIHVHPDLIPKIDDSEIHMDLDVVKGRLENYAMLQYMSDYFKDKNLSSVLFDTLNNNVDIVDGVITIPNMTVNSSLGHMQISGKQALDGKMEYYIRIPWKMVSSTAKSRLFGKKKDDDEPNDGLDEIQYGDEKTKYVNVKITGDYDSYKFSIGKDKSEKKKKQ